MASTLQSEINVTPLVDVCLVLLIIFMVVMPTIVNGGVAVLLPDSRTAAPIDGELKRLHGDAPDRPVLVRADARVKYGSVASVLAACRASGFLDISLATKPR